MKLWVCQPGNLPTCQPGNLAPCQPANLVTWQPGNLAYLLKSDIKGAVMFELRKLFAYGSFDQLPPVKLISIKITSCLVWWSEDQQTIRLTESFLSALHVVNVLDSLGLKWFDSLWCHPHPDTHKLKLWGPVCFWRCKKTRKSNSKIYQTCKYWDLL